MGMNIELWEFDAPLFQDRSICVDAPLLDNNTNYYRWFKVGSSSKFFTTRILHPQIHGRLVSSSSSIPLLALPLLPVLLSKLRRR